ncbi:MAG TPA: tetratricopeptide repeat protein [Rhodanobacteraceae bacterium]|nr:tetratricopeptide repeat protein [Rhodanobacteraceae bacterium]
MTAEPFQPPLLSLPALFQQGRYAEAATALRRALELSPGDPSVAPALHQAAALARNWLTLGRTGEALAFLAPLAESERAGGALWMLYGHALMAVGRKCEAEAVFRRWNEKEP